MSQSVRKGLPSRAPEAVPDSAARGGEAATGSAEQLDRLERLRKEFEANAAKPPAGKSPFDSLAKQASGFWSKHSRASKLAIGLLLLAVVGWLPIRSLLQATSTEAVVNARLVTLRAPIEGDIEAPAGINVGTHFKAGDTVLRVVNRRADRSRLDDLTRLIDQLESERAGTASRIVDMAVMQAELTGQLRSFQEGRLISSRPAPPRSPASWPPPVPTVTRPSKLFRASSRWRTRAASRPRLWSAIGAMRR